MGHPVFSILVLLGLAYLVPLGEAVTALRKPSAEARSLSSNSTLYGGLYRPQIHFSPPQDFMNDPNGLFLDAEGTYHLYYQYNPTALVAGDQHWGHATTQDLYHWVNQPIALSPPTTDSQMFSGSAVIDVNNTSGFFPNQTNGVVAIYTLNTPRAQVQEIAYSLDGGYTFERYAGNPVIDVNSTQFRDPKVIWHADSQRWVMVVAHSQAFVISFYTSQDLKTWSLASEFSHHGLLGLQWECPNLVQMPVRGVDGLSSAYVLTISINPGAPLGGSATQYFPGTFDGTTFTPFDSATRLTDFAKDNYAGQFFYGIPDGEDALSLAWASNWQYAQAVPTASEGWRSAMTLPRRMYLTNVSYAGWELVQTPADLRPVRGAQLAFSANLTAPLVVDYSAVSSNAVFLEANVSGTDLNFTFASPFSGESLSGGLFVGDGAFVLDRGGTRGFDNPYFTDKFSTAVIPPADGPWTLSVVIDRSTIEVFVNGGVYSATATFFAMQPLTQLTVTPVEMSANAVVSVAVFGLESGWTQ